MRKMDFGGPIGHSIHVAVFLGSHGFLPRGICYRHLAAIGKEPQKKSILPNKNDENLSPVKISPKFKPALSKELGATNGESMAKQSRVYKDDHKSVSSNLKELQDQTTVKISGATQIDQPLLSASQRLPHRKPGEHQPEFSLDYLPPMTFPPVHN
ncbi:hypothetical protein CsSME_00024170 [Camellia sinensis var. sinensis]